MKVPLHIARMLYGRIAWTTQIKRVSDFSKYSDFLTRYIINSSMDSFYELDFELSIALRSNRYVQSRQTLRETKTVPHRA